MEGLAAERLTAGAPAVPFCPSPSARWPRGLPYVQEGAAIGDGTPQQARSDPAFQQVTPRTRQRQRVFQILSGKYRPQEPPFEILWEKYLPESRNRATKQIQNKYKKIQIKYQQNTKKILRAHTGAKAPPKNTPKIL